MEKNNNNLSTFVIFFLMDKRLLSLLFIVITDEKKIEIYFIFKHKNNGNKDPKENFLLIWSGNSRWFFRIIFLPVKYLESPLHSRKQTT